MHSLTQIQYTNIQAHTNTYLIGKASLHRLDRFLHYLQCLKVLILPSQCLSLLQTLQRRTGEIMMRQNASIRELVVQENAKVKTPIEQDLVHSRKKTQHPMQAKKHSIKNTHNNQPTKTHLYSVTLLLSRPMDFFTMSLISWSVYTCCTVCDRNSLRIARTCEWSFR